MENFNFIETPNTSTKVIETITLTTNEYLSFPTFFVQQHKLREMGSDLHARLFYDKGNKAIAVQFVDTKDTGFYKVNLSDTYGATCKVKAFLLNNEIDSKKAAGKHEYRRYSADKLGMTGGDVFVIKLSDSSQEGNIM